jgi:protein TonB
VPRFSVSVLASTLAHGLLIAAVLMVAAPPLRPALVIPVSLVAAPGGGGGDGSPAAGSPMPPEAVVPAEVAPPPPAPAVAPAPRRIVQPRPVVPRVAQPDAPVPETAGSSVDHAGGALVSTGRGDGDGSGGSGGGSGGGAGGGDGSGAGAAYASNPLPPYPMVARRLGKEGVVLLEVLVSADGYAADVRVLRSCGFPPLDDSAVTTVRDRWRFVPARHGATPVESRVTVPIRFRLNERADARG